MTDEAKLRENVQIKKEKKLQNEENRKKNAMIKAKSQAEKTIKE